jgi:hypothetical protein
LVFSAGRVFICRRLADRAKTFRPSALALFDAFIVPALVFGGARVVLPLLREERSSRRAGQR